MKAVSSLAVIFAAALVIGIAIFVINAPAPAAPSNSTADNGNYHGSNQTDGIDMLPPTVSANLPLNASYSRSPVLPLNVSATDLTGVAGVIAEVDWSYNITMSSRSGFWVCETGRLDNGPHSVRIIASDLAGNSDSSVVLFFTVDAEPPELMILEPRGFGCQPSLSVSMRIEARDRLTRISSVVASVSGGGTVSLSEGGGYYCGTLEVPAGDGVKNITVTARDALGNERTASVSVTIQRYIKGPGIGEGCNNNDNIFNSLTVSPTDPNVIYVGSEGNGIFKSTDGGGSWQWLREGFSYWTASNTPGVYSNDSWYPETYDMVIDPRNSSIIYAVMTDGAGPPTGNYPSANGGVFKSTDGGLTWVRKISGLPSTGIPCISMDPVTGTLVVSVTNNTDSNIYPGDLVLDCGVYASYDGGESWVELPAPEEIGMNKLMPMEIREGDPFSIYVVGNKYIQTNTSILRDPVSSVGLVKSTDGGTTWSFINPFDAPTGYFTVSADGNLIYASDGCNPFIYASEDGGASWQRIEVDTSSTGFNRPPCGPIAFSPDEKTVFFAAFDTLFKSTDGISTYSCVLDAEKNIEGIAIAPTDPDIIYVGTTGLIIYKSVDGGNTFTLMANLRSFIDSH